MSASSRRGRRCRSDKKNGSCIREQIMSSSGAGRDSMQPERKEKKKNHILTHRQLDEEHNPFALLNSCALLGDTSWALGFSFFVLMVSIYVALLLNGDGDEVSHSNDPDRPLFSTYKSLGPIPYMDRPPRIYHVGVGTSTAPNPADDDPLVAFFQPTSEMRAELERDGALCVRGLISEALLARLDAETYQLVDEQRRKNNGRQRRGTQFYTVSHSSLFRRDLDLMQQSTHNDASDRLAFSPSALMEVALWSPVPAFAASLLLNASIDCRSSSCSSCRSDTIPTEITCTSTNGNNNAAVPEERLRVIRDIFLAKDDDDYVCGWHVDDMGFWPATPESPGINVWIALDDMEDVEKTGGFALAVQSHTAPWRDEAYYWTGAPATSKFFPDGGYANASAFFEQRTGRGTCHLREAAPHLHRRMEETARIFPVRRGDVIFHTRWLFHRTVAVGRTTTTATSHAAADESKVYRRYSIRYGPGSTSIVPPGYGTELSVLWNESNGGLSVDEICETDGPWYPQAWPPLENRSRFGEDLSLLLAEKIPVAEERRERRKQEMRPYLKRIAKQNHQFSTYGQ